MAFDGIFLSHLIKEFDIIKNTHVNNINFSKNSFIFNFGKKFLIIDFNTNRSICYIKDKDQMIYENNWFSSIINTHLKGSKLLDINQHFTDRIVVFDFLKFDNIFGPKKYYLIFEATGKYANLFLLDNDNIVISSYKRVNISQKYEFLKSDKISSDNFTSFDNILMPSDISNKYLGISIKLSNYLFDNHILLNDLVYKPTISFDTNDYHAFDIFPQQDDKKYFSSLSDLLVEYINKKEPKNLEIKHFLENKIKKIDKKYIDTLNELDEKKENLNYKEYADILKLYINSDIDLPSVVEQKIDQTKSATQNLESFYTKYKKSKIGITYIQKQLKELEDQREKLKSYLDEYSYNDNISDIDDFINQLIPLGYMSKKLKQKTQKSNTPNIPKLVFDDFTIKVGKNSHQNEYLLKTSSKNDYWFHIKAGSGSHVIVSGTLSPDAIKYASMLALYYSSQKFSTNVDVDYTTLNYVSRIRKQNAYNVSYINYKTTYTTVDDKLIYEILSHKI